jgi:putative transposase
MKDNRMEFDIGKMCIVFKVSRSGFYASMNSGLSFRANENQQLTSQILKVYVDSKSTYGSPRIAKELNRRGTKISRPRVARLMKKAKIRSIIKRKFKITTDSEHPYATVENKLERNFKPGIIGAVWVSDITYIKTKQGWLYLTTVIDLGDRKVVGWALSSTLKAIETVIPAFKMAQKNRSIIRELLFHSDRGMQYACNEFSDLLRKNALITRSMSRKGNCWDNAVAESFFKTLKAECTYQNKFETKQQAALLIFEYIEIWYNRKRLHSALGYISPQDFEKQLNKQIIAA